MKKFICLVLGAIVFVEAAPSAHPHAAYTKERVKRDEACLEKVKIDKKVVEEAVKSVNSNTFPADDQKYKEYLTCSYKKQGFQSDDGVIQYNQIKDFLSEFYKSGLDDLGKSCNDVGKSHGDKAFDALVCVVGYLRFADTMSKS